MADQPSNAAVYDAWAKAFYDYLARNESPLYMRKVVLGNYANGRGWVKMREAEDPPHYVGRAGTFDWVGHFKRMFRWWAQDKQGPKPTLPQPRQRDASPVPSGGRLPRGGRGGHPRSPSGLLTPCHPRQGGHRTIAASDWYQLVSSLDC